MPEPEPEPSDPALVASAEGIARRITVEDRDGRRILSIDGVVQGSVAKGDGVQAEDPLLKLARAADYGDGPALLVGLGTGRTATELATLGPVDVIELEPHVIVRRGRASLRMSNG